MSVLFRVEDEPPASRLEYLRDAVESSIAPFEIRVQADGRPLRGASLRTGSVGAVGITRATALNVPFNSRRTPLLIRRSDPELFTLNVQVRGGSVFAQGGRAVALSQGDLTLIDLSR